MTKIINENKIINLENKKNNLELIINKDNQKFRETIGLKSINYKDISNYIKPNELYIDFIMVSDRYFILTLGDDGFIGFVTMSKEESILLDKYIKNFQSNIKKIETSLNTTKDIKNILKNQAQKTLSKLYDLLITRYLEPVIKDKTSLIISPDSLLNFLPFEALYYNGKYLIENYEITYSSSGREFIRQTRRKQTNKATKVVIFGSPNFDFGIKSDEDEPKSINSPFDDESYEAIDSSKEINIIKKYYDHVEVYEKDEATVENLMKTKNPKILHISTHGFFFNDENISNPMLRPTLAMTSANRAAYESNRTGIVTALKLSSMELPDTELVVLSACETGLGKIYHSEGVAGLSKAFIQAGAKKVVMSLWKVSEQKTAILMKNFYKHIAKGESHASALRSAKLEMLTEHPFYWSAFVMSGI